MIITFSSKHVMNLKLCIIFLLCTFFTQQTFAAQKFTLSPRVGQQVSAVFELYELGKLEQALTSIKKIKPRSPFDKAYISRFKGNLYWETGDEKNALIALKSAVSEDALAEKEQRQSQRMVADLYLNQKQATLAIEQYQILIDGGASQDLYKHLAIAYYQQKSWHKLVDATQNAIKLSAEFNQSVHILQLSGLYELKDYKNANKVLVMLTQQDPDNKRWWMQLASTYRLLKQDKKALATYELAYQQGFMSSSNEIKQLANFRASLGAPYQAALLLESALKKQQVEADSKTFEQLAMFWQAAREYDSAQQYWGKSAGLSGEAKHYLTQAQLLYLLGQYEQVLTVLALAKSESESLQGKVGLTQIQALFALKKYQSAKRIALILTENNSSKERAQQWVKLLDSQANAKQQFAM